MRTIRIILSLFVLFVGLFPSFQVSLAESQGYANIEPCSWGSFVCQTEEHEASTASGAFTPIGPQRVAVFILKIEGVAGDPPPVDRVNFFFRDADISLANYWQQVSGNKTKMSDLDIFGPYSVPEGRLTPHSNLTEYVQVAVNQASLEYEQLQKYQRIFVIIPNLGAGWGGLSSVGSLEMPITIHGEEFIFEASASVLLFNNFQPAAIIHEAGHQLGWIHSASRDFGRRPIGHFHERGTNDDGGDCSSAMSWCYNIGYVTAPQRAHLGWLAEENIEVVSQDNQGLFVNDVHWIKPREWKPFRKTGEPRIQALKILREHTDVITGEKSSAEIWVEFVRKQGPFDSQLSVNVDGALIHYVDEYTAHEGNLLDFHGPTDFTDAVLHEGGAWKDKDSSLQIKVVGLSSSKLGLRVTFEE